MTRVPAPTPEGPVDPRRGRQRYLVAYLQVTVAVVFVLAVAAVVLPDDLGHPLGVAMIALLALAPLVRVGWLLARWLHRHDLRFAGVAAGLLGVVLLAVAASRIG